MCTCWESHQSPAVHQMNICTSSVIPLRVFVIPTLVWWHSPVHSMVSLALWCATNRITITQMGFLYQLSDITVTRKANRNPLLGFIHFWNWPFEVYPPHSLRHCWRLTVTRIHSPTVKSRESATTCSDTSGEYTAYLCDVLWGRAIKTAGPGGKVRLTRSFRSMVGS